MMHGSVLETILDAREICPGGEVIVIAANGDERLNNQDLAESLARIPAPTVELRDFRLEVGSEYVVVINGGVNHVVVPLLCDLVKSGNKVSVYESRRSGVIKLWQA